MEARIRDVFAQQAFMHTLGASLVRVHSGEVELRLPITPALTQHTGVVHAGVIAAVVDSACGAAAATLAQPGAEIVSIEFKLNLLAPASAGFLRAIGRVVRAGRTVTVCTGEAWAVSGDREQLVAVMQATMMSVTGTAASPPPARDLGALGT